MNSDLAQHILSTPLCDTHEHLGTEADWENAKPDILTDLFANYVTADLVTAGASAAAMKRLMDQADPDIAGRFEGIRSAWEATRFTGYGSAVRIIARELYGMDELTPAGLREAQVKLAELHRPRERRRLLEDRANLDHVQIDNFNWPALPDPGGHDFFLYDINWQGFCSGSLHPGDLHKETGIDATDLKSLRAAQEAIFAKYAGCAIAVKSQHAYGRTLDWHPRTDDEAAAALAVVLDKGNDAPEEARLCLGDWSLARGVELAIEHNLPFKIHTGYYAGNWHMAVDRIKTGQLHRLLRRYEKARFVLMHIAYPYSHELVAMAKHFPNVWVDLCWAWSIDPYSSAEFVRRFLHAVPANKLFAFGGDTFRPTSAVAYAFQARQGLTKALEAEVADGDLSEKQAIGIASRLMRDNAHDCFDVKGTREALERR